MALPSGYTRLEYIQSSGTQYIDTGFKPNQDTKVIFQFKLESTGVCYIYGCRGGDDDGYNNRYGILHNDSGFRSDYGTGNGPYFSSSLSVNTKYYSNKNRNVCSIGDASVTNSTATFQSPRNMFLFGVNEAGSFMYGCTLKVYSCQIYDNDTLVRDFVPCTNSAGTAGLYDTVNGVFYQSAGSGAFTAGPEKKGTHKTMVDGTAYEIKGGRTLVDGTAYDVKKGKTLVGGTAYEIGFGCTVTINVRCDWKNKAYVVIDGTKYDVSDSGGAYTETISVQPGTTMECYVISENGAPAAGQVLLNGTEVASHWYLTSPTLIYTYTISGNIKVTTSHSYYVSGDGIYGKIKIVEQ